MVLVDLSNKNKTFCKKIINLLKNSDQNIIINSKYLEYEENNIEILNIENEFELIKLSERADIVLIFNINDYKKYADYCKRIIFIYDSKNTYLPKNRKKINLEFKDIDDIYEALNIDKTNKPLIMKSNIDIFFYFIFVTIIFILSLLLINKDELNKNIAEKNTELKSKISNIENGYTNYLFLGDSITEFYNLDNYYGDYKIVNSGVCGNQTEDILNDLKKRAYVYNPSTIFLLIGTNDLEHKKTVEDTQKNIKEIVNKLNKNLPNAKIYLESIYPVNDTDNKKIDKSMVGNRTNDSIKKINSELKKYCNDKNCTYLDVYSLLEDKDGNLKLEYTKEGLHMSDKGYEVITKELKKYMHK